jgi:hypothetical protein
MTKYFTPENSALLLIDHQIGTMQLIKNIDVERAKRMRWRWRKWQASSTSRPC